MTLKELAATLGLSTATVSRALNDDPRVTEATMERVKAAAEIMKYRPNVMAKALACQKTFTIGFMIPDITNAFYGGVMRGIEDIAGQNNYSVIIFNTDYMAEKERHALDFLRGGRIDGLIGYASNRVIDECIALVNSNLPLVLMGQFLDEVKTTKIGCNNISSAYEATEYLIKAGHRRIMHVAGNMQTKTAKQRLQGYKSALEAYDIPYDEKLVVATDYEEKSAYENAYELIRREGGNATAIFAANDTLAVGCYRAVYDLGMRIPDDISIVGHDDHDMAVVLRPCLTTMRQDTRRLGNLAAQHMFSEIASQKNKSEEIIIPTKLIERDSVKFIRR